MKILALLILLSNIIALILALVYYHLNNKVIKEYERKNREHERRLKLINKTCDESLYLIYDSYSKVIDEESIKYILSDIINIIERGRHL